MSDFLKGVHQFNFANFEEAKVLFGNFIAENKGPQELLVLAYKKLLTILERESDKTGLLLKKINFFNFTLEIKKIDVALELAKSFSYEELVQINCYVEVSRKIVKLYESTGNVEESVELENKIIKVLWDKKNIPEVIKSSNDLLKKYKVDHRPLFYLVKSYAFIGDWENFIKYFEEVNALIFTKHVNRDHLILEVKKLEDELIDIFANDIEFDEGHWSLSFFKVLKLALVQKSNYPEKRMLANIIDCILMSNDLGLTASLIIKIFNNYQLSQLNSKVISCLDRETKKRVSSLSACDLELFGILSGHKNNDGERTEVINERIDKTKIFSFSSVDENEISFSKLDKLKNDLKLLLGQKKFDQAQKISEKIKSMEPDFNENRYFDHFGFKKEEKVEIEKVVTDFVPNEEKSDDGENAIENIIRKNVLTEEVITEENFEDIILLCMTLELATVVDEIFKLCEKKFFDINGISQRLAYLQVNYLYKLKKYFKTISLIDKILEKYPEDEGFRLCLIYLRAESYKELGRTEAALADYHSVRKIDKDYRLSEIRIKQLEKN